MKGLIKKQMAFVPKNICTHDTEQDITATKTFTEGLAAKSVKLLDGTELKPPAIETIYKNQKNKLLVANGNKTVSTTPHIVLGNEYISFKKEVKAPKFIGTFSGDGAEIENISATNIAGVIAPESLPLAQNSFTTVNGNIQIAIAPKAPLKLTKDGLDINVNNIATLASSTKKDYVLLYSRTHGISKVEVPSLISHINDFNGRLFNFVNDAKNVGKGISVLKGKKTSGRNQALEFKSIVFDDNFIVKETSDEIRVSIKDLSLQEALNQEQTIRERVRELEASEEQAKSAAIAALQEQISQTLEDLSRAEGDYTDQMAERKRQIGDMSQTLAQLTAKNNNK